MSRCLIICGGDCSTDLILKHYRESDCVICADSGYVYAHKAQIKPNIVVGDFDSLQGVEIPQNSIKLPVEKDITDSEAAIIEGVKTGCDEFLILGGTGGRFEHTFANISLMAKYTSQGFKLEMIDDKHCFYCLHNSSITLDYKENQQISVFAFGEKAYGVTERGFHYPLENYTLDPFEPLGISNDIVAENGEISVENGTIIIIETTV